METLKPQKFRVSHDQFHSTSDLGPVLNLTRC